MLLSIFNVFLKIKSTFNYNFCRSLLGDLSNATSGYITDTTGSFFSSPSIHWNASSKSDISGVFSECEYSTPKQNVKRKLSVSFADSAEVSEILFFWNGNTLIIFNSNIPIFISRANSMFADGLVIK